MRCRLYWPRRQVVHLCLQKTVLTEMTSCVISRRVEKRWVLLPKYQDMHQWSRQKVWLVYLFFSCSEYAQWFGVLDHLSVYTCVHLFNDLILMRSICQANMFYVWLGARPIFNICRSIMSNAGNRTSLQCCFFPATQTQHPLQFPQCHRLRSFIA